jgi:hypothetical protein
VAPGDELVGVHDERGTQVGHDLGQVVGHCLRGDASGWFLCHCNSNRSTAAR